MTRAVGAAAAARALCSVVSLGIGSAWAAPTALSAWQEIVLLTVIKAQHAVESCGFHLGQGKVEALLRSADLATDAPSRAPLSPSLRRQVTADADAYRGDRDNACGTAWARFGADATPGMRDLVTR